MNVTAAPRLEYLKRDDCWYCSSPTDPLSWSNHGTHIQRNVEIISFVQLCRICGLFEQAMIEAQIESRRYTEVELERCMCGRTIHSSLGFCVSCWRQRRMISEELRQLKLTRDIVRELRRRAKQEAG